jgi:hypothetical protein
VRLARRGDVILTTNLSLPAVWWYGNLPVPSTAREAARQQGEAWPVYEAQPAGGYPRCEALAEQLGKPERVLVYLGFRFDDWPDGYDDVLFARLAETGEVTAYRQFEGTSVAFVVDLARPPAPGATRPGTGGPPPSKDGCVEARPARAW